LIGGGQNSEKPKAAAWPAILRLHPLAYQEAKPQSFAVTNSAVIKCHLTCMAYHGHGIGAIRAICGPVKSAGLRNPGLRNGQASNEQLELPLLLIFAYFAFNFSLFYGPVLRQQSAHNPGLFFFLHCSY
jgi:hypothetical protein